MKKNRGYAKVEFLANLAEIKELFQKGCTKRYIYDYLYKKGKISMTYIHFCRFDLSGNIKKKKPTSPSTGIRTASALPALPGNGGGGPCTRQQDNFSMENKITEEELDELT
ncbi:TraK family protein [Maridesulfovibrio hydrothermalis]|uniref:TraK family protein n=1 Tax=Maridesulfovibrio hydrothermalis TaxID=191026 RepID=UPI000484482D|nr:TraK family protein [Maridesulfovibrio hydrothermalis]